MSSGRRPWQKFVAPSKGILALNLIRPLLFLPGRSGLLSAAMAAPLKPRNAGDFARARELRPPLPSQRPVLNATGKHREFLLEAFRVWVEERGVPFSDLFDYAYQNVKEINAILSAFGRELYQSGWPLNIFSQTVNSIAT